ncbi:MAG TPA: aquaporin [Pirellulales bacterium]|jgi:MIP family channel proteins|nr:aquaporin [Pirellulales bacterium]
MIAKSALAELIGTFTLVFIGAGAGSAMEANSAGTIGVAFAHGLALLVIVYAWGSISGAHVNPAVTLGVAVAGRMDWPKAVAYWIAQFAGGIAAAYLLQWFFGPDSKLGSTTGSLTPMKDMAGDAVKVVVLEGVLTFFLVAAVFASGVHGRNGNMAGLAIGMVLTMDILAGGSLTGASMNPARTLGPALATGDLSYVWMYFVGPLAGGAVAALVYDKYFLPAELTPPVEAAEAPGDRRR